MEKYDYRYTRFYTSEVPERLKHIEYENKTILDLGAGDGEIIYGLWKNNKFKNTRIYAVEISPTRCKLMDEQIKQIPNLFIFNEDAAYLDYIGDNEIDIIICNQVIEHVEDEDKLISEIYRVLKTGGTCYLSTVFKQPINMGYYWNKEGKRVLDPTHLREYTNNTILKKLEKRFGVVCESKTMQWFSITDFLLKRLNMQGHIYEEQKWLNYLRKLKLPIIGYYNWEFIIEKGSLIYHDITCNCYPCRSGQSLRAKD